MALIIREQQGRSPGPCRTHGALQDRECSAWRGAQPVGAGGSTGHPQHRPWWQRRGPAAGPGRGRKLPKGAELSTLPWSQGTRARGGSVSEAFGAGWALSPSAPAAVTHPVQSRLQNANADASAGPRCLQAVSERPRVTVPQCRSAQLRGCHNPSWSRQDTAIGEC